MAVLMPGPSRRKSPYGRQQLDPAQVLAQMVSPEAILASIMGTGQPQQSGMDYLEQASAMADQFGLGGGGGSESSSYLQSAMQAINQGYRPEIIEAQRALEGSRAQEAQDIADIQSWYGQLGGAYRGAARQAGKAGKKGAKRIRRDAASANEGVSGVAAKLLADDAGAAARSVRGSGRAEAGLNRALASNTMSQADYAALVRSRLHAGERESMLAHLNSLRAKKAAAKSSARLSVKERERQSDSEGFSQMMQLAQFLASQSGQAANPLEQMGMAMGLLQQGGQAGLPGFEQYAPEPQVDPAEMLQLYQGVLDPGASYEENQERMRAAAEAFGLSSGGQNNSSQALAMLLAGVEPEGKKGFNWAGASGIDILKRYMSDPRDKWYENPLNIFK